MDGDKNVVANFVEAQAPTVTVLYPNGGQVLPAGAEVDLQWSAEDNVGVVAVDVFLSRAGSAGPYDTLATGLPNSGLWRWEVGPPPTSEAVVKVVVRDAAGNAGTDLSDAPFAITEPATDVTDAPGLEFGISSVAPNPTRGAAFVGYTMGIEARVRLSVLDLQGREIAVLVDGARPSGRHRERWDGKVGQADAPAGVYFVRLETAGRTWVRRVALTR